MSEQSYSDWITSNPELPTKEYKTKHMAQQTAVEWLAKKFEECELMYGTIQSLIHKQYLDGIIKQAKQMEKEQIMGAYKHGQKNEFSHVMVGKILITGEEYYEQTFTTQAHDKQG